MPGLAPGIHVLLSYSLTRKTWMAGTSPAMTLSEKAGLYPATANLIANSTASTMIAGEASCQRPVNSFIST